LNAPREISKYLDGFDSDAPQCPLIVHQADEIHRQAKRYFEHTGSEMPLSAKQDWVVRCAPAAKKDYYEEMGEYLVANGSMGAS
jgi:hypothetical protein